MTTEDGVDECWHTFSALDRRTARERLGQHDAEVRSPCLHCGTVVDLVQPAPQPQSSALFDLGADAAS